MPRAPRIETPVRGLYQNGRLWWVRTLRSPASGRTKSTSTGYPDVATANRVAGMLDTLRDSRAQWDWFDRVIDGELTLRTLYERFAAGQLAALRVELDAAAAESDEEDDLAPLVDRWAREHLAQQVTFGNISARSAADYVRQTRAAIPAGEYFAASEFTEDVLKEQLGALEHGRTGGALSSSTLRRYLAAWRLFYKWARRQVELPANPFEESDWQPGNAPPRDVYWEHDVRLRVLAQMTGEHRVAAQLMLGSGVELCALPAFTVGDVSGESERRVFAKGTKNQYRRRHVWVDRWAWQDVFALAAGRAAYEPLFTAIDWRDQARELRTQFYRAQVAAGLFPLPDAAPSGRRRWASVANLHRLHDSRHTFVVCRILGLDGEPARDAKFCAHNLGHANEQMVLRIYGRLRLEERLRLLEQQAQLLEKRAA